MTGVELYELVWRRPMTHVAKDFGLSDVGLRKICVKYGIPTPPLGYWAKLAHGKVTKRPPLPATPTGVRDEIAFVERIRDRQYASAVKRGSTTPAIIPEDARNIPRQI